jgi:uncharacterized protein with ParB-like and HNH nuclease domain
VELARDDILWGLMTTAQAPSREIDGKGRSVRQLLDGQKYSIDYYQREYKWQTKHATELIEDLAAKFLDSYAEGHVPTGVRSASLPQQ